MQFLTNRLTENINTQTINRLEFLNETLPEAVEAPEENLDAVLEELQGETRRRRAEGEVLIHERPNLPQVMPALPTLYTAANQLDLNAQERHMKDLYAMGCRGFVVMGTTGESATVTFNEHEQAVQNAIKVAQELSTDIDPVQIVAGCGANWTAEQNHLSAEAINMGAQATLLLPPYYVRPQTQASLLRHFWAALDEGPGIVYRVTARSGIEINRETIVSRLSQHPNFLGIKECDDELPELTEMFENHPTHTDLRVWSGEEGGFLQDRMHGSGAISVGANARWDLVAEAYRPEQRDGRIDGWMSHQAHAAFAPSNPIAIHLTEAMRQQALGTISEHGFRDPIRAETAVLRSYIRSNFEPLGIWLEELSSFRNFNTLPTA